MASATTLERAQQQDRRDDAGRHDQPDHRSATGFQSLTAAPFTIPAKDPNYIYQQVVILLTDGLNTQNRFSTDQTAIDLRTKKVCDNIKNAGILLYALQVNTSGDPTRCCNSARATAASSSW